MMTVSRGDVVLVDYPFTDRSGSKVRPCVVVQSNAGNSRLDDTIVALMTSTTRHVPGSSTEMQITAKSPDGRAAGLLTDSAIQCQNLLTIDRSFIRRRVGAVPQHLIGQLDNCLKSALDLK
jgi:mRNA interferase MazF